MKTRRKASASAALAVTAMLAMPPAAASAHDGSSTMRAAGGFLPPSPYFLSNAPTYDWTKVPVGARVSVIERVVGTTTKVELRVAGLVPNHMYGAHVHTKPCGRTPDSAGPHYQDDKDPHQPSTDPAYANADNEVWLDFTTNARGHGAADSRHDWRFRQGEARAVVIHEHGTMTDPGDAGTAGARLACLTVPFAHVAGKAGTS